ncbi:hypothetical protein J6590_064784 [Homalodisca vitripennis]|nr:hypothetical protein J6590_064784 [Homalodisca vitripennis]
MPRMGSKITLTKLPFVASGTCEAYLHKPQTTHVQLRVQRELSSRPASLVKAGRRWHALMSSLARTIDYLETTISNSHIPQYTRPVELPL